MNATMDRTATQSLADRARAAYEEKQQRDAEERRYQEQQARRQHQESLAMHLKSALGVEMDASEMPPIRGQLVAIDNLFFGFSPTGYTWKLYAFGQCPKCQSFTPALALNEHAPLELLGEWLAEGQPCELCGPCYERARPIEPEPLDEDENDHPEFKPGPLDLDSADFEDPFQDD